MPRTLSPAGRAFIQQWETLQPIGMLPTPHDKPTAGWGHCGPDVEVGVEYPHEQCQFWFSDDVAWAERAVDTHARPDLTQNQVDALISLCFNIGEPNFDASTLLRDINAMDDTDAAQEFLRWNKQGGVVLDGLTRRRKAESALFLTPDLTPDTPQA